MNNILNTLASLPILPIHLLVLALTFVVIVLADHDAYAYFRGSKQVLDRKRTKLFHLLVWVGLVGMILSGFLLFWPSHEYLLSGSSPLFILKMFFVSVLVINALFIGKLMEVAFEKPFVELSRKEKIWLCTSGAISAVGWFGAVASAFFIY